MSFLGGGGLASSNPQALQQEKAYADLAYKEAQLQNQVGRQSQLLVVSARHSESMAHLAKRLDILAQRLQPLLRPTSPTTQTQPGRPPEAPMAPLAAALSQVVDEVDRMNMLVEDLLGRIEI